MIVFDLTCEHGHRFEGWFGSSDDFESQLSRGLVACPECGTSAVMKAPMAPAVPAKSNTKAERLPVAKARDDSKAPVANHEMPAEVQQAMAKLAEAQAAALKNSTFVGGDFAKQSREMHYGERDETPIHGQATLKEAKELVDEGVPVAPLPFPVAPPEKLN
ncbi:MAG: DUF1178 family protein [Pseudomonadota bacterium]